MSYLITFSPLQSILMLTELTHAIFFDDKARRAIPFMCPLIRPRALLTLFLLLECPSPPSFLPTKHYHLLKKARILFRIHLYLLPVCSQQVALPVLWLFRKWPCVTLSHKCFRLLYEWALSYDLCFCHGLNRPEKWWLAGLEWRNVWLRRCSHVTFLRVWKPVSYTVSVVDTVMYHLEPFRKWRICSPSC